MKIKYNAPVLLSFVFICAAVLLLSGLLKNAAPDFMQRWFSAPPRGGFSPSNPRNWVDMLTHVLGHADFQHLTGNLLLLLVIGPMLEDIYGSLSLLLMIAITALTTGLLNVALGPGYLMGASGVVFMMILLASFTNFREGELPLTFILVVVFYLGQEVLQGITRDDNVSHFTHIAGGVCGSLFGFFRTARAKKSPAGA